MNTVREVAEECIFELQSLMNHAAAHESAMLLAAESAPPDPLNDTPVEEPMSDSTATPSPEPAHSGPGTPTSKAVVALHAGRGVPQLDEDGARSILRRPSTSLRRVSREELYQMARRTSGPVVVFGDETEGPPITVSIA